MAGDVTLDVAIGMFFLYLLLSLMCSAIQEFMAALFAMRANNLEAGIRNLLEDPNASGIADKLLVHPLIARLAKDGKKPSYIPSRTFALALMDSLGSANKQADGDPVATLKATVAELPEGGLKTSLSVLIADAQGDAARLVGNIGTWFDDKMDRVSGWYKRKVKLLMLGIAFVLAAGLNVDSIHVAESLWSDPGLRAAIVAEAQSARNPATGQPDFVQIDQQLHALSLPMGWHAPEQGGAPFGPTTLLGWLITAICVSLGAPFWFDALEKALNIRAAGNKPQRASSADKSPG